MFDRDDLALRSETLIDEINMIKWSQVSPQNRALPDHACDRIVSINGNWVAFNAEAWKTQMEDSLYLIPEEWGAKAFCSASDVHCTLPTIINCKYITFNIYLNLCLICD